MEVSNIAVGGRRAECERVAPEPPLEDADGIRSRTGPDEGESGFAARKAGIEEA
jgi:hypothetical protein